MYVGDKNIVDFVGRMENLESDTHELCKILNVTRSKTIPHSNKSNSKNYREIYTAEMKDVISECYSKDIELLGYEF